MVVFQTSCWTLDNMDEYVIDYVKAIDKWVACRSNVNEIVTIAKTEHLDEAIYATYLNATLCGIKLGAGIWQ